MRRLASCVSLALAKIIKLLFSISLNSVSIFLSLASVDKEEGAKILATKSIELAFKSEFGARNWDVQRVDGKAGETNIRIETSRMQGSSGIKVAGTTSSIVRAQLLE